MDNPDPKREWNSPQTGFTDVFLTHAHTPQNFGVLSNPDGFGAPEGECGDTIGIYLHIRDYRIQDIAFITDGCAYTIACASVATSLAKGRTLDETADIDADEIMRILGGLPQGHIHCAELAASTLRLAIQDYFQNRRESWKKHYR